MLNPKVSVIVPIYNAEKYVERCVISLLQQSYENCEFIFVDDCSPDSSVDIIQTTIKRFQKEEKIKIVTYPTNRGSSLARKAGLEVATGEYICFVDADDWVESDYIQSMISVALHEDADFVWSAYYENWGNEQKINLEELVQNTPETFIKSMFCGTIWGVLWARLMKKSLLDQVEFPQESMSEDFYIMTQYIYKTSRIAYNGQPAYHYFENPNSVMRKEGEDRKRLKEQMNICKRVAQFMQFSLGKNKQYLHSYYVSLNNTKNNVLRFCIFDKVLVKEVLSIYPSSVLTFDERYMRRKWNVALCIATYLHIYCHYNYLK